MMFVFIFVLFLFTHKISILMIFFFFLYFNLLSEIVCMRTKKKGEEHKKTREIPCPITPVSSSFTVALFIATAPNFYLFLHSKTKKNQDFN